MNSRKAHNFYYGLNLHFNIESYSMLKYGVNTKAANARFDSLSTEQQFRFEWLARKYPVIQDLVFACIGSQFEGVNLQFDDKESVISAYLKLKGRRDSMTYTLKNEYSKFSELPFDKLMFKFLGREISPEYLILSSHDTTNLEDCYSGTKFSFSRERILKLIKYREFFPYKKYLSIFEKEVEYV